MKIENKLKELKAAAWDDANSAQAAHLVAYDLACCDSSESACKAASIAADDSWHAYVAADKACDAAKEDK